MKNYALLPIVLTVISLSAFGKSFNSILSNYHPYIVKVLNQEHSRTCTGTLLSPRIVLTAAHCINKTQTENIKVSSSLKQAEQPNVLAGFYLYFSRIRILDMNLTEVDLALLYLKSPLENFEISKYPKLLQNKYELESFESPRLKVVGFAEASAFYLGESHEIESFEVESSFIHFPSPSPLLYGASGGPTIIKDEQDDTIVVGVNSLYNPITKRYRVSNVDVFFQASQFLIDLEQYSLSESEFVLNFKEVAQMNNFSFME
jgi:hypothetical protein